MAREKGKHRGIHKEKVSPKPLACKLRERLNFMSSYNQQDLKPGGLKVSGLAEIGPMHTAPGEKAVTQPWGREHGNSDMKNTWITQKDVICAT